MMPFKAMVMREAFSTPLDLFHSGEKGCYFRVSDMSTLFTGYGGQTAITTNNQPLYCILDKRLNGALSSELITDVGFDNPAAWSAGTGWVVSGGLGSHSGATPEYLKQGTPQQYALYNFVPNITVANGSNFQTFYAGQSTSSATITTTGVKSLYIRGYTGSLQFATRGVGVTAITSLSVKKVLGNHGWQGVNTGFQPLYKVSGAVKYIDFVDANDVLQIGFPDGAPGTNCTVAYASPGVGAVILTGQTVGTDYAFNHDFAALVIIDRPLTSRETLGLTAWLNTEVGL
jgi:hypothetical protein